MLLLLLLVDVVVLCMLLLLLCHVISCCCIMYAFVWALLKTSLLTDAVFPLNSIQFNSIRQTSPAILMAWYPIFAHFSDCIANTS